MTHLLHLGASFRGDRSVSRMLGQDYINQRDWYQRRELYL
jgi:hypothetical protein